MIKFGIIFLIFIVLIALFCKSFVDKETKGNTAKPIFKDYISILNNYIIPILGKYNVNNINREALDEYETKLARFDGVTISRIRVAKFNAMSAVYIDKERICFGGKKSTYEEAVKKALAFADALLQKHPEAIVIDDASKSATGGCSSS